MPTRSPNRPVFRMALTAVLSAMSIGLYYLEFPLFSAMPHLKLDFSDFPALFAGVVIGPWAGVVVELIKNLVEFITKGLSTQLGFGNLMNFAVGCAYVLPVSLLYHAFKKRAEDGVRAARLALACAVGMLAIVAVGLGMNYLVAPLYFRFFLDRPMKPSETVPMLGFATALNAIKAAILSAEAFLLLAWRKNAPKLWRMFEG